MNQAVIGAAILSASEHYTPRQACFDRLIALESGTLKLNLVAAESLEAIADATVDGAVAQIRGATYPTEALGAGFAILHQGKDAVWLLVHWWLRGGIASRVAWRADLSAPTGFEVVDSHLMACVWELGVIDFERRSWMETAMAGRPIADYLASALPRSIV